MVNNFPLLRLCKSLKRTILTGLESRVGDSSVYSDREMTKLVYIIPVSFFYPLLSFRVERCNGYVLYYKTHK